MAGAVGGMMGGLLPQPLAAAALSATLVGLLQALTLRPDLRYGAAWFGATSIAGTLGFAAAIVGARAFTQAIEDDPYLWREGLAAWIGLGAMGGLLLAAAQAPLTGRRRLASSWCLLGLLGGGALWPAGLAIGYRFGPDLALWLAEINPTIHATPEAVRQAAGYAIAWLLHSLPFGILIAATSAHRR
jgi:hypothetical protein